MIARKGITGATLADIAAEAGCGYGVVSFHFKSKDRLLLAVLNFLAEEFIEARCRAIEKAGTNPAARLDAVVALEFNRSLAAANKIAIWTAFWAEASRNPAYRERCVDARQESLGEIEALIREITKYEPAPAEPELIAHAISAVIDGFLIQIQIGALNGRRQRTLPQLGCRAFLRSLFPRTFASIDQQAARPERARLPDRKATPTASIVPILGSRRRADG